MRLQIIAVGTKMPSWVESGCADYLKRMPRELGVKLTTIPVARSSSKISIEQLKLQESALILKKNTRR